MYSKPFILQSMEAESSFASIFIFYFDGIKVDFFSFISR